MPKFSVVIAVYNKEKYIGATLQSVLDQSFTDFEIVIVNDGSTDNSEARIQQFDDPRIRFYSEENRGAAAARNFVIEKAEGDYIALLDGDDLWADSYLEVMHQLIEDFPEHSVFCCGIQLQKGFQLTPCQYSIAETNTPVVVNYFEASHLTSIALSSSTVLHRSVFEKAGKFNSNYKTGEDTDFYVRMGMHYEVVFTPEILSTYRQHDNTLSVQSNTLEGRANFEEYIEAEASDPALKKFLDLNRYSLCILARLEGNRAAFDRYRQQLDPSNLNRKQRFLLNQNATTLRSFMAVKKGMDRLGLRLTAFK